MKLLVLAVFCIDDMGIKMTFRCAGHAVLNKKCDVHKPLTGWDPAENVHLVQQSQTDLPAHFWTCLSGFGKTLWVQVCLHLSLLTYCTVQKLCKQIILCILSCLPCSLNSTTVCWMSTIRNPLAYCHRVSELLELFLLIYIDKLISTTFLCYSFWGLGWGRRHSEWGWMGHPIPRQDWWRVTKIHSYAIMEKIYSYSPPIITHFEDLYWKKISYTLIPTGLLQNYCSSVTSC